KPSVPRHKLLGGEQIVLKVQLEVVSEAQAEPMSLDILFEDEAIMVINKPAGLVMHPGAGNHDGTLLNGLLAHNPSLAQLPRAGIVHRLDKETTGLLVVAKTLQAHKHLVDQLQARSVSREYEAVAYGTAVAGGTVDEPLGRHPSDRRRVAVRMGGKEAITHYRVLQRFTAHTHLRLKLETGRTHQIRVHMAHIHLPLVGDQVYSGRLRNPAGGDTPLRHCLQNFKRQALHAARLALIHPVSGEEMAWTMELPEDFQRLLAALQEDLKINGFD
ncbi:MAG: 23S rRNA pseudouridine(1911/1915/1917) synthase RluD, partial [Gammaproteobacteria bacterium]|nr:23S rRNA pseudouridine(1911/1915/1917) synthase RluD [Gammaproteobacteria bacterium]